MPCWYFDKKELIHTPSSLDGIQTETEGRYRREGARFIIDAGTKLNLSYETCATGVVYFHRFYMVHSFKEFHRYVMGACCLFLAGKVEETPKKCRDIVKIAKTMLSEQQFSVFGEDPREEVMTLERVLLQTIKFDFQVDHPYSFLLKYAKQLKGDKPKIQKMVQMGWTFINDSLCTMLCLQWEPEIIAVSLMYLASRLSKYEIHDWNGKQPGAKTKWFEFLIEGLTMELLEDVCHQVLDLYSSSNQAKGQDESPPQNGKEQKQASKHSVSPTPPKQLRVETGSSNAINPLISPSSQVAPTDVTKITSQQAHSIPQVTAGNYTTATAGFSNYYAPNQVSGSFMTQQGSQNIQTVMSNFSSAPPSGYNQPPNYSNPPPNAPMAPAGSYQYPQGYANPAAYQAPQQQPQMQAPPGYPPPMPQQAGPPPGYNMPPQGFPAPAPLPGYAPITGPMMPPQGHPPPPPVRHPPAPYTQPPPANYGPNNGNRKYSQPHEGPPPRRYEPEVVDGKFTRPLDHGHPGARFTRPIDAPKGRHNPRR